MTATAALQQYPATIDRADLSAPILFVSGRAEVGIRAGTVLRIGDRIRAFEADTPVRTGDLIAGEDYGIRLDADGTPFASLLDPVSPLDTGWFGGFHFAPGGNAIARSGGDRNPAINPYACWDLGFRPTCPDPRGMTFVETGLRCFWEDIYLLNVDHLRHGTSRCGATIADGRDLPQRPDGKGRYARLDYAAAVEICAHHGKRLLGAEEFIAGAFGVMERCSRDEESTVTGTLEDGAERFISARGVFDATGTMSQWGTDGDPDNPRPSIFGGSWLYGDSAGSRCASRGLWGGHSNHNLGVRAASDHMSPA